MVRGSTIALTMITLNEEALIGQALDSVKDLVDEMIIVDTGSADRTKEIAISAGARVIDLAWTDDFAAARNFAIENTDSDWVLVLDADEVLPKDQQFRVSELISAHPHDMYLFDIVEAGGGEKGKSVRLFRNRPELRYHGRVHENLCFNGAPGDSGSTAMTDIALIHYGYSFDIALEKEKRERNIALLAREMELDPGNSRLAFYLAKERGATGDYKAAAAILEKCLTIEDPVIGSQAYKFLVDSLERLGHYEDAAKVLGDGLEKYPTYADLVYLQARNCALTGEIARAIELFNKCTEMDAGTHSIFRHWTGVTGYLAYQNMGRCYYRLGDRQKAGESFLSALENNGNDRFSLYCLVYLLSESMSSEEIVRELSFRLPLGRHEIEEAIMCVSTSSLDL